MKSKNTARVIVIGSSNTDLVVPCRELPQPGQTVLGGDLRTFAGGKGANQAVAAARAGARVHFIAAFGDDAFGRARRSDLEAEGIDCSACVVKKNVPSGVALIALADAGENSKAENQILVAPGANARLSPQDVTAALRRIKNLSDKDIVLASLEIPFASVHAGFSFAQKHGCLTILNPAPYPPAGLPRALLEKTIVLTPNENEFRALLHGAGAGQRVNAETEERLLALTELGCAHVIVTRGEKGVSYFYSYHHFVRSKNSGRQISKNQQVLLHTTDSGAIEILGPLDQPLLGHFQLPAPTVKAVDTVGAGDCFSGALAAHLAAHQYDFENAIRFAVSAAALKVTRPGAQSGMPKRSAILRSLKTNWR